MNNANTVGEIKSKLQSAMTQFDAKESKKKSYNRNALGIYFARIDEIAADIESGASVRAAIMAGFSGRGADACLRACGLPISTDHENRDGAYFYRPSSSL